MTKKHILKIAFVYTGTILGAGFATGKELVSFFAIFNKLGILGFFIACFLMSICAIAILNTIYYANDKNYEDFMYNIFGSMGKYIHIFNMLLLFVLFSAMLAGGGATISSIFSINEHIGIFIFCILTFLGLIFGKNAIIVINSILCPVLIAGGMLIGIYLYYFDTTNVFNQTTKAIISPFVYTSYNTITTISVLFTIKNIITSKKVATLGGILGGIFIFLIGIFILLPLVKNIDYIINSPLPILSLINDKTIKNIYSFTVLSAIFTTAVSNGVALESSTKNKLKIKDTYVKIFFLILGVAFSTLGFSSIVSKIYPLFGYLGIFEILVIIFTLLFIKNPTY